MKRILQFILIACLASGCVDAGIEEVNQSLLEVVPEVMPDVITISLDDDTTRVQLDASGKTVWTKDDCVSAFYKSDANNMFRFVGETGDRDGKFKIESEGSATRDIDNIVLLYPYSSSYKLNAARSLIDVYIPATQYYAEGSYGVGSNLMASVETDDNFTLRSLCGWIVVQLEGDATITSITLSGNNGEQLAGDADFDYDKFNLNLVYYPENSNIYGDSNGGGSFIWGDYIESVTLDCGDGVKLNPDKPTEFYFVVPPQIFTKGINIKAECQRGAPIVKSSSKSLTVQRNHIVPMSTITANVVIPNNQIWYTSTDGTIVEPKDGAVSGGTLVSNTFVDGMGIMTFSSDVTALNQDAFNNRDTLKSIILPNSLISIGNSTFYDCTSLTSVTIPDSVTTIGEEAFYNCYSLTSVTIGNGVTLIGDSAFYRCNKLTSVTIPDSVTSIGQEAFSWCTSLTSVTIPDSVTTIGERAFKNCYSLTSVTIPDSVTSIGEWAFYNCTSLTSVTIGNSVTSIGNYAFYHCDSLTSVTIGNGVTSIGTQAFRDCYSLTSVTIGSGVTSIGERAFSGCSGELIINSKIIETDYSFNNYPANSSSGWLCGAKFTKLTIGDIITKIGRYAFRDCSSLTSVTIGNSVTSIGQEAFYKCSSLTSVTIPDSVTSIGDYAFSDCTSLTSVTIPDSVTSIGGWAFYDCSSLTSVTIGNSVTSIGTGTFNSCSSLTSVTIGNSVTSIGGSAFSWCDSLKSITIPDSVTSIGGSAFSDCSSLTSVTIGNSVTSIGTGAFYSCSSLESVTIPDSVTTIGGSAFYGCSSLESFYGKFASEDNRCLIVDGKLIAFAPVGLTEYTIPDSVTSIGEWAFDSCDSLESITIPDSVTSIGEWAFDSCDSLESVTIPDSVTTIGDSAFYSCTSLTSFYGKFASEDNRCLIVDGKLIAFAPVGLIEYTIPDSVTTIGEWAFYNCDSLTSVTIPDSVTSIGGSAFYSCRSLTSVYCKPTTPPAGGPCMFYSYALGREIYVPAASVEAYKSAAYWRDYADYIVGYNF